MRNSELAVDYVRRARARLGAIDVLYEAGSWADVVRESQEAVELALKGMLRSVGIDPPRVHDVSELMLKESERLPGALQPDVPRLASISRDLRRDRELSFYGAEDLTPSGFYGRDDAVRARDDATFVVNAVAPLVLPGESR